MHWQSEFASVCVCTCLSRHVVFWFLTTAKRVLLVYVFPWQPSCSWHEKHAVSVATAKLIGCVAMCVSRSLYVCVGKIWEHFREVVWSTVMLMMVAKVHVTWPAVSHFTKYKIIKVSLWQNTKLICWNWHVNLTCLI